MENLFDKSAIKDFENTKVPYYVGRLLIASTEGEHSVTVTTDEMKKECDVVEFAMIAYAVEKIKKILKEMNPADIFLFMMRVAGGDSSGKQI